MVNSVLLSKEDNRSKMEYDWSHRIENNVASNVPFNHTSIKLCACSWLEVALQTIPNSFMYICTGNVALSRTISFLPFRTI